MGSFEKNKYKFSTDIKTNLVGSETIEVRRKEVDLFAEELTEYNIFLKDLIFDSPSYSVRNTILNIAYFIIEDIEIFEYIQQNKKLPLEKLIRKMPISKAFFTKWSDFIFTYLILLANPKYAYLQEYLNIVENVEVLGVDELKEEKAIEEYRGVIISIARRYVIILTSKGEFKKIRINGERILGEDVTGKEKKTLAHYKYHLALLASLIVLMCTITIIKYNSNSTILVIETTSQIRLEVNTFGRVLTEYSSTDKGKEMLGNLKLTDEKLDDALYGILNYAIENDMIPRDGVMITVTGDAIGYGQLPKSEEFINDNNLEVKFNNSGNEHKM